MIFQTKHHARGKLTVKNSTVKTGAYGLLMFHMFEICKFKINKYAIVKK